LIEYIDAFMIGALLMVVLWFRPQGVVPERIRLTASFGAFDRRTGAGAPLPDATVEPTAAEPSPVDAPVVNTAGTSDV
ncbi:MAG TPA: hypothetical protein VMU73_04985, partial [Gaiellaceae bacterium]|nr:hypothetical protein [Gaiellaceae bacterium]